MSKDNKKKIFNFCFIAFSSLILIYILMKSSDISSIYDVLKDIKLQYVLIAIGCLFIFWLLEAYMIFKLILKFTDKKGNLETFWLALKTTLVGQYYSNITPGASGGQPVQLYIMKGENVPLSEGTAILVEKFLLFQVGVTIYSLALAIYKLRTLVGFANSATWFVMIGLVVNILMILCIWLISIKPKFIRNVIGFIINFLAKCRIIKDLSKAQNDFEEFVKNYEISIKKMKNNKMLTFKLFALTFVQLTLFFSITYFIYKSFNLNGNGIFEIICLQAFVYMSVSFVPIPGTIGASEMGFMLLLGNVFSKNIIGAAILMWRGISYYFSLIFSGIFVILISIFKKYKPI